MSAPQAEKLQGDWRRFVEQMVAEVEQMAADSL
jgi:hypothetical protein